MITVQSVNLSFDRTAGGRPVLQDISFHLAPYESCAIIGPSGCGKTSLLFLLSGLLEPDSGTIEITGNPHTGTILQNFGLFPWKTVYQNIGLGLVLKKKSTSFIRERVTHLVQDMGLVGFEEHYPGQLSGGMQQRVALARSLATEPEILFMDEPLSSLDALTRERLQNLILDVWKTRRITAVLVTHSIEEAVFLGRRIIVLSRSPGKILRVVENPGAGEPDYRQSEYFFHQCGILRQTLEGEDNGQKT